MQVLNVAVLSRLLPPSDFGLVAMSTSVVAFISLFRDFGLSTAAMQRSVLEDDTASGIFAVSIAASTVLVVLSYAIAGPIAAFFGDPRVSTAIIASSGVMLVQAIGGQHTVQLTREMRLFRVHSIILCCSILGSIGAIFLALLGAGYWALIASTWISAVSQTVLFWISSPWRPRVIRDWSGIRTALDFGLPLTGSAFVVYFSRQFDKFLIGWRWGAMELGLYSRAYTILLLPQTLVSGPISSAVVPGLSRIQMCPSEWRSLLLDAVRATTFLSLLASTLLVVNAREVVAILLGSQWERSADLVTIFGVSMIARTIMNQNPWIYVSLGRTRRMLLWQVITLPLYIFSMGIGLTYGIEGIAIGFCMVQACLCVPSVFVAAKDTPVTGVEIMRVVTPMCLVAIATVLVAPSLCFQIDSANRHLLLSALNLTITSVTFSAGAMLVLALDPSYRTLRDTFYRRSRLAFFSLSKNLRKRRSC